MRGAMPNVIRFRGFDVRVFRRPWCTSHRLRANCHFILKKVRCNHILLKRLSGVIIYMRKCYLKGLVGLLLGGGGALPGF